MPDRICQRPGCGRAIPSNKRKDARWCSRKCEGRARRAAEKKAAYEVEYGPLPSNSYEQDVEDRSLAADDDLDDEHPAAHRPRKWVEDDERFAALIAGDEGTVRNHHTPRRMPLDAWRRWRAESKRNPGVEPPEQTADRVARQRAAYDASMSRIDRSTAGRVQDRHDPRTAPNVAGNAIKSRALNAHYVEQPPIPSPGWDFTNETVDGGPYRSGRASGRRSGHADYRWELPDGFTF